MDPSFGARLRLQRERHQIPLTDIAERTKIKLALLEGLERDDLSHWPTGIFRRSYVREYSQAIGLQPDTVVREFLELYPDPIEEGPAAPAPLTAGDESARGRPPTRLRFMIGSALNALPALRPHASIFAGPSAEPFAADDSNSLAESPPGQDDPSSLLPAKRANDNGPADLPARASANGTSSGGDMSRRERAVAVELSDVAHLCMRLARAAEPHEVVRVLEHAARLLDAVGLIVWIWDLRRRALRHVLSVGYSSEVLAQLPDVPADTDNAIAASYRSAETRCVNRNGSETGAVVVPLPTPKGCAGVLALELRNGGERRESIRAFAGILAAQLSTLIGDPQLVEELTPEEDTVPCADDFFARES